MLRMPKSWHLRNNVAQWTTFCCKRPPREGGVPRPYRSATFVRPIQLFRGPAETDVNHYKISVDFSSATLLCTYMAAHPTGTAMIKAPPVESLGPAMLACTDLQRRFVTAMLDTGGRDITTAAMI